MSTWNGTSRVIYSILLAILGFIGLDTLLRALQANEGNAIVGFVRAVANVLLAPFDDVFLDQNFLLTALIAVLFYSLIAAILIVILGAIENRARAASHERAHVHEHERTAVDH
jgi:multisubunit Na+/H+ antiporter MnhG subunit